MNAYSETCITQVSKHIKDCKTKFVIAKRAEKLHRATLEEIDFYCADKPLTVYVYLGLSVHVAVIRRVASMYDALPDLEFLENLAGPCISSEDTPGGSRLFAFPTIQAESLSADGSTLRIDYSVIPDDELASDTGRRCRRVHIGDDVRTETASYPRYAIVCD